VADDTDKERAIVLAAWPQPAAGAPKPRVLANDTTLSLLYRTEDNRYAVIRFPLCIYFIFGMPNDEALGGHPLSRLGLRHYSVHEVVSSALIRKLERRNSVHPQHDPESYLKRMKHYIFTFQDSTLECVVAAEQWWVPAVALFTGRDEAEFVWRSEGTPNS
jgi:hypothetical protein